MQKRLVCGVMLAGLAGVGAASAQDGAPEAGRSGLQWYYAAGIPVTNIETDSLIAAGSAVGATVSDELGDLAIGGQGTIGLMFARNWGLELRYSASGNARDDLRVTGVIFPPVVGNAKVSLDGFTFYAVTRWPIIDRLDFLGKLGYTLQDVEIDADFFTQPVVGNTVELETTTFSESDDEGGLAATVGLHLQTGERWAITAELEYLGVDFDGALDEPYRGSVNLEYQF